MLLYGSKYSLNNIIYFWPKADIIYFLLLIRKSIFAFLAYGTWTNTNSENTLYTAPNFVNLEGKINYSCELYIVLNVHVNKYYPRFIINILRFIILYYKQEFFFLNHFNMNSISAYLFFLPAVLQLIE